MANSFFAGFLFYLALAAQLGPQNTFLLRQGILKQNGALVIFTTIFADIILVVIGALGFGRFLNAHQIIMYVAKIAGIAFLFWYSYHAIRRAFNFHNAQIVFGDALSRRRTIMTTLAFSWNPSTLFDLIVLLGITSATYGSNTKIFALGAIAASSIWNPSIVLVGRLVAPLFGNKLTWSILDVLVAIVMFFLAISIMLG